MSEQCEFCDDPDCVVPTCHKCGDEYTAPLGYDPSKYCDECAHKLVDDHETTIATLTKSLEEAKEQIEMLLGSANPSRIEHETMFKAWQSARAFLSTLGGAKKGEKTVEDDWKKEAAYILKHAWFTCNCGQRFGKDHNEHLSSCQIYLGERAEKLLNPEKTP